MRRLSKSVYSHKRMRYQDYRAAKRGSQRGFTLLELLVVIAIIGLLSSVALASLTEAREKARDAVRASTTREMRNALELYFTDFGQYPAAREDDGSLVPLGFANTTGILAATVRETPALRRFYADEPRDPLGSPETDYGYATNGTSGYALLLYLESNEDYCKVRVNAPSDVFGPSVPDCVF